MNEQKFDYIKGRFIDRMARSGFPDIHPERSLWQQFPIGTDMTKSVLRGVTDKVMLSRSSVYVIPGHHHVAPECAAKPYPGIYAVHHFKWDASVVSRLKRRLEKDWRERCTWWVQSARALQWLENTNGQPLSGLQRHDFLDDESQNGGGPFSENMKYPTVGKIPFVDYFANSEFNYNG